MIEQISECVGSFGQNRTSKLITQSGFINNENDCYSTVTEYITKYKTRQY